MKFDWTVHPSEIVTLGLLAWAFLRGYFSRSASSDSMAKQVQEHEDWIKAHELCSRKQMETLNRVDITLENLEAYLARLDKSYHDFREQVTNYLLEHRRNDQQS